MEQAKIVVRSGVKVHEVNSESLRQMWKANLSDAQRAVFMGAGIFPFVNAVAYQCNSALCAAVIDFMVDGQLTVGDNRMQITEEHIRQATGLPNAGISVSPSRGYERADLTLSLTGSVTGANASGLLLDRIVDPCVQFACKFLAWRLLGVKTPGTIPFKYVAAGVQVSQGVCFNWCKFVKERMLEQIESVQKGELSSFDYPTILQYLALKAFGEFWIPRIRLPARDPGMNLYTVLGRDFDGSKEEKKAASGGVSYVVLNITKYHGHRVLTGDGQGPDSIEMILSRERSIWEAEKKHLESQNQRLHNENTRLEAALVQTNVSFSKQKVEMQRRIGSLETARRELQAKLNKISEVMTIEVADSSI